MLNSNKPFECLRIIVLLRPTFAEINLDAIASNMSQIRKLVGPGVKICPAVKADGYGHGAVEVSREVLNNGAEMLSVATLDEAVDLREAGIDVPILLLQCIFKEQVADSVHHDITNTICDYSLAEELSRCAGLAGKRAKVHIKVDTGMGRMGIQKQDALDFVLKLSRIPNLDIEGIFTHFPSADEDDLEFTYGQINDFKEIIRSTEEAGIHIPLRHMANSAAILHVPEAHLTMVRPGIMLYGLYDYEIKTDVKLRQCLSLKTRISFLKDLPSGCSVSYGRTYTTTGTTRVATIPIGYADGYNRHLSNRAPALVRGKRVPVIGRVCMDQTMLDVTNVPDVSVGDEVVLYGSQGDQTISIEEIAGLLGTISYEVICSVSKRVPRVYVRDRA